MKKISFKTKLSYAVGNLGYGTVAQTVNSFIMFFGTSVLGVSGSLIGIAIALSAFWDGISDPLVGYYSDRHKSKIFGRRLGFMLFATFGICICNIFLWIVPNNLPQIAKFFWILITLLGIESFNTFFATPYVALGIDLAPDYNEQATLQGFKTVFFIIGMILPSILMIVFMPATSETSQAQFMQNGYINIAYFTSILCLICGAICILGTLKTVQKMDNFKMPKKDKNAFFKIFYNFFSVLKKKNYGPIIVGYSVALISSAFLTSVGLHLFTFSYHFNSTQIPILMTILFISAILSQPFWIYLSKRIEKKNALNTSLVVILVGIAFTALTFIFRDYVKTKLLFALVIPCIFICGFGTGALYSLPISMFADIITVEKIKTGENNSATYSGFMTLAYNIANSIALLIIGVLLDLIKFNSAEPVQPKSVQNWLGIIVFLGCSISIALSMRIFARYKLTRKEVLKCQLKQSIKNEEQ